METCPGNLFGASSSLQIKTGGASSGKSTFLSDGAVMYKYSTVYNVVYYYSVTSCTVLSDFVSV